MAKNLEIKLNNDMFSLAPIKIERKKVYGWTELRVTDLDGTVCRQVGLDSNGQIIIPKGAVKQGIITENGSWMEKSELIAVKNNGEKAEYVPSSFDNQIQLSLKVSVDVFLSHLITSVYQLDGEDALALAAVVGNDIFTFPFSYRGGYKASTGFLLSNGTNPFIFVGEPANFEFIGLQEQGVLDEPEDELEIEDDDIDFSMM